MIAERPTLASRKAAPRTRPARGSPQETRRRLIVAAGVLFNTDGYDGTDSNRIARKAGYSPGAFYKHFPDKQAIFVAVYDEWVAEEWRAIDEVLTRGGSNVARHLTEVVVSLHKRWRIFRRSLRATRDPAIRRAHLEGRKRQLDAMSGDRVRNLFLLYAIERAADALAEDETEALDVEPKALFACVEQTIAGALRVT